MKLFHTSPNKIEKVSKFGNFDDCLFFSTNVYEMSAGETITYSINADDMRFIDASDLHDSEVIAEIAERFEIDLDDAESLLDGSDSVWNHDFADAENDWFIQAKRGECAKRMGFDGCKDHDEQGVVYIIPMLNRESILVEE
ncbi:hypothetical protein [Acinetobacter parvus]|uniref:Uncharacterized protein n=1 Tax=Acinetobacter parvus DSM 16617 = CIP 108168 TaxID=981333 RepID=N8RLU6_9GAMM|nr:hypothetical protein [Acinetobacter parvus]ENU35042.1 hypothetical protein F988_02831 [Acinetobacter parvus DSM 16617 = CIP 108168]ENU36442.1 hypothetical protein F988_01309 [Acinetobacter parvus DSM 16617 = CIP 108168]